MAKAQVFPKTPKRRRSRLIEGTNPKGDLIADYIYLGKAPLALLKPKRRKEAVYFYHDDHLGAPGAMTDQGKRIVWTATFDPFGNAVSIRGRITNNLRFPGQYYDHETGLDYNGNRYYDPAIGRYTQPDPIGLRGGLNRFAYVQNDPVNLIDPFGLCPLESPVLLDPVNWISGLVVGPAMAAASVAEEEISEELSSAAEDLISLYHQGDLEGGVSGTSSLSTSTSSDLAHYDPTGTLYEFQVPQSTLNEWMSRNLAQPLLDMHAPTGIITQEIRIMSSASGQMNQFLIR